MTDTANNIGINYKKPSILDNLPVFQFREWHEIAASSYASVLQKKRLNVSKVDQSISHKM